jgi:hypothetical protein
MRPLCGAIITAGALIGLGLFSMGYGTRYSGYIERNAEGNFQSEYFLKLSHMDTALIVSLTLLVATLGIGLAIAFVGLAYHHHKRHLQMLHHQTHGQKPLLTSITSNP